MVDFLTEAKDDYPNLMKSWWGRDDLIVVEQDKVPTMADFDEIVSCPKSHCIFPHHISFYPWTTRRMWTKAFPYGLGFVKFNLQIQRDIPVSEWIPIDFSAGAVGSLDRSIEEPMTRRFGPMHLHGRFIKHNHGTSLEDRIRHLRNLPLFTGAPGVSI